MLLALCLQSRGGLPLFSLSIFGFFLFNFFFWSCVWVFQWWEFLDWGLSLPSCTGAVFGLGSQPKGIFNKIRILQEYFNAIIDRGVGQIVWVINMAGSILCVDYWIRTPITFGTKTLSPFHLLEENLKCKP